MQQVLCPQCGAPVSFQSAASVMAVCGSCRSTLLKEADSVRRLGEVGELLEDYSPICLGAAGRFDKVRFTVLGRLQMRYEDGFWNEWYIGFDNGTDGWLSDASGQYAITHRRRAQNDKQRYPQFGNIEPGQEFKLDGQRFTASDVRSSRASSAEGELPFSFDGGWSARSADYRSVDAFLTLDYSDGDTPEVYIGRAFDLKDMDRSSLRTRDEVLEKAGRVSGRISALACPNCGGSISIVAAMATQVVCPSCGSAVDCSGDTAVVIETKKRVERIKSTLSLGQTADINKVQYSVIGLMQCTDPDPEDGSTWIEYLLYAPEAGFLWLVETDEGWERVAVCDTWPVPSGKNQRYNGLLYREKWTYTSRVDIALGAFNWRVKVGDQTQITDYEANDGKKLSAELSEQELGWSASREVSGDELALWFKMPELAKSRKKSGGGMNYSALAMIASVFLVMINSGGIGRSLGGLVFLWLPAMMADKIRRASKD